MTADGLLTAAQAAALLGVSPRTFRKYRGVPRVLLPSGSDNPDARPIVRYDPAELRLWWRARLTHQMGSARDARDLRLTARPHARRAG